MCLSGKHLGLETTTTTFKWCELLLYAVYAWSYALTSFRQLVNILYSMLSASLCSTGFRPLKALFTLQNFSAYGQHYALNTISKGLNLIRVWTTQNLEWLEFACENGFTSPRKFNFKMDLNTARASNSKA